ncbi:hypothetical protein V5O48_019730, partial [Marasmius crinis-equi]
SSGYPKPSLEPAAGFCCRRCPVRESIIPNRRRIPRKTQLLRQRLASCTGIASRCHSEKQGQRRPDRKTHPPRTVPAVE